MDADIFLASATLFAEKYTNIVRLKVDSFIWLCALYVRNFRR